MVTFSLIIKYSYGRQGRNTGMSGRSLPSPAYWTKLAWKLTFRNEQLYYHFYPLASSTKVATAAAPSKYFRNCVFPWFGVVDFSESILMERCVWRVQLYRSKSCLRKLMIYDFQYHQVYLYIHSTVLKNVKPTADLSRYIGWIFQKLFRPLLDWSVYHLSLVV